MSPSDGEAFLGPVVARAPAGADGARLLVDGRPAAEAAVRGGRVRFRVRAAAGRRTVRVVFTRRGAEVGAVEARGAWLLPPRAGAAVPGRRTDAARVAALRRALAGGPAYRAAWVQDLTTGATAGVAAGAAFPAASTVKIGLLVGALRRLRGAPERSPLAYDLRAMAGWSSNLATNRLLRRLGGPGVATDGLRRLGARVSTFPGEYIVGTELQPGLPPPAGGAAPPRVSRRVTTRARPRPHAVLPPRRRRRRAGSTRGGRAHGPPGAPGAGLAAGVPGARRQRRTVRGGLAPGTPIAQKNGWIRAARHGAAIAYTDRGPVIAVVLTYDAGGVSHRARTRPRRPRRGGGDGRLRRPAAVRPGRRRGARPGRRRRTRGRCCSG